MVEKKQTPMMAQYLAIKETCQDAILFYRMGDFYEMFLEDAVKAASILEIALTSRNKNDPDPIPMCGLPYKAADLYIAKLIEKGCKVAVCEQVEAPSQAKGLVKREIVRVITPGMILNDSLLDRGTNNFLVAISKTSDYSGLACIDISTGSFTTCQVKRTSGVIPYTLLDEALKLSPKEVLLPDSFKSDPAMATIRKALSHVGITYLDNYTFRPDNARQLLTEQFATRSLEGFGIERMPACISAAGAAISYVRDTQLSDTSHIYKITPYNLNDFMVIDDRSCKNLELLTNIQTQSPKGSLIHILDKTVTAMGGRLIKQWIRYPLVDKDLIRQRLHAIEELIGAPGIHQTLGDLLKSVYDLERLGSRISMGQGNARDMLSLKNSLSVLPDLFRQIKTFKSPILNGTGMDGTPDLVRDLEKLAQLIGKAIREDAVHVLNEGNLINDGYSPELDELLSITRDGKSWIAKTEKKEKENTGLSSLKIKYNKVFGYFIEVSKAQSAQVPDHYIRKQTLVNAERFITQDMKAVEDTIFNAQERRTALEYEIFCTVREKVAKRTKDILIMAQFIAALDVVQGLAKAAVENAYAKPDINDDRRIDIQDGRHPVVEKLIQGERYVPNSIVLDDTQCQQILITGPNMAGKSTVLRQVALTVLMAQMGSFVPAVSASICVTDRIFTRVGALDNLSSGQSTFMVEMEETANIVNNATEKSLVILDEIGRGTSTYDGMSIAWAVAEYLHDLNGKGVKTLFATHYHELLQLEEIKPRIKNYNIEVKEFNDNIVFLRSLVKGGTNRSYGIQVARLAGVPDDIIDLAKSVLASAEHHPMTPAPSVQPAKKKKGSKKRNTSGQMSLFGPSDDDLRQMLQKVDIAQMTPLDALNFLNELKRKVEV
ncbi:DNA mismatch repair protein MutS [Desulfobacter hydrogenophilus]|uniref:DNA mismatch repair protein MutS n=1 Tax=Desulfobacter hydrogenophilus TaxID=2291 RepID=A0A328FG05_9BACT|nr:DNA mismatch repair protein MutS [Desulfobacter hydrogenophilus]NDY70666.1 DNA mismatch repair protein MutS [Desulfobacter hydrogenophilus]QBH14029.1 DNA mismatch repair protein MutS [Desulfobacter hydrogenophilus]RAM03554.1 DNA mismatch repair protein MutS [Desulfobacter hydrogenophilus]